MEIKKKVFKVTIFEKEYELSAITNGVRRAHSDGLTGDDKSKAEDSLRNMLVAVGLPLEVYDELDDEQTASLLTHLSNKKKSPR